MLVWAGPFAAEAARLALKYSRQPLRRAVGPFVVRHRTLPVEFVRRYFGLRSGVPPPGVPLRERRWQSL